MTRFKHRAIFLIFSLVIVQSCVDKTNSFGESSLKSVSSGDIPTDKSTQSTTSTPIPPVVEKIVGSNKQLDIYLDKTTLALSSVARFEATISPGNRKLILDKGKGSFVSFTDLLNGQEYTVSIIAISSSGKVSPTSVVKGAPKTLPSLPEITSVEEMDKALKLNFNVPNNDGGSSITKYEAVAIPLAGGSKVRLVVNSGTGTTQSIVLTGLVNEALYNVSVVAYNQSGKTESALWPNVIPSNIAPPGQIRNLAINPTAMAGQFKISWLPPISSGGAAMKSYQVNYSCLKNGVQLLYAAKDILDGQGLEVLLNGSLLGSNCTVSVIAYNAKNKKSVLKLTTDMHFAPGIPTGLTAEAQNAKALVKFTAPVFDGGSSILKYVVYVYNETTKKLEKTLETQTSPVLVDSLTNKSTYTFKITAKNSIGESPYAEVTGLTPYNTDAIYKAVKAGGSFTCGLTKKVSNTPDGKVRCWGSVSVINDLDYMNNRYVFTRIDVGNSYACGLTTSGTVVCWGGTRYTSVGYFNLGTTEMSPPSGELFVRLALADSHTCGITDQKNLYCWGLNNKKQLGFSGASDTSANLIQKVIGTYTDVSVGANHTCATTLDGSVKCWGTNSNGILGTGSSPLASAPVALPPNVGIDSDKYSKVWSTDNYSCGLSMISGSHVCWGSSTFFKEFTSSAQKPVAIDVLKFTNAFSLAVGENYLCGLEGTSLKCLNNIKGVYNFKNVDPGTAYVSVSTKSNHACGLTDEGEINCWGSNLSGQLGIDKSKFTTKKFPGTKIKGYIDAVIDTGKVVGWACMRNNEDSIDVKVYAGGGASSGILLGQVKADKSSEPAVAAVCAIQGSAYRFEYIISKKDLQSNKGKAIFVFGVNPYGIGEAEVGLTGNGNYVIP